MNVLIVVPIEEMMAAIIKSLIVSHQKICKLPIREEPSTPTVGVGMMPNRATGQALQGIRNLLHKIGVGRWEL